jgi:hypothetical protein
MELRHHPLMSHRNIPNWPPIWTSIDRQKNNKPLQGEIGVLVDVVEPVRPARCFLVMEHDGVAYRSCLLFDDRSFCRRISKLFRDRRGHSIQSIGGLDFGEAL